MIRSRSGAALLLVLLAGIAGAPASAQGASIDVLFLSSFDLSSPDLSAVVDAMKKKISDSGLHAEIYVESLDLLRLPRSKEIDILFEEHLAARYENIGFEILVAQTGQALETLARFRDAHARGVPVFCFDMIDADVMARHANDEGTYARFLANPTLPTIRLAARLFPRAERIFLLVTIGNPAYVQGFDDIVGTARAEFPKIEFVTVMNADYAKVEATLSAAEDGSPVLLLPGGWRIPSGRFLAGTDLVDLLSGVNLLPYFGVSEALFGTGLVGGSIIDRRRMGLEAGEMVLSILFSEVKPVRWLGSSSFTDTLDFRALKRFSVPSSAVPPGARLLNEPPSFWIAYEGLLKSLGLILVASVFALVAWTLSRRRKSRLLAEGNERLERTVSLKTEELRNSNAELEASNENLRLSLQRIEGMQERLVSQTRDTVLGRIALGLAHDINNPLAAIRASLYSISGLVGAGEQDLISSISAMSAEESALFFRLHREARDRAASLSDEGSAAMRRALEDRLRKPGACPEERVADAADLLVDAGLEDLGDEDCALICRNENRRVLEALYRAKLIERVVAVSSRAVERISQTVEAVRSYARGATSVAKGVTASINDSIGRALSLFHEPLRQGIAVRPRLGEGLPPVTAADTSLVRLWTNLIQNAIQAMDGRGELEIVSRLEDGCVVVEMLDSGPGVPPEIEKDLFTPFAAASGIEHGLGLGLSVCKRIAEGCGGTISHGERGGRTMFAVRLPVAERADG